MRTTNIEMVIKRIKFRVWSKWTTKLSSNWERKREVMVELILRQLYRWRWVWVPIRQEC